MILKNNLKRITFLSTVFIVLFCFSTQVFAEENDKLISSECFIVDGYEIQENIYLTMNGTTYTTRIPVEKTEDAFNAIMKLSEKEALELKNRNLTRDSINLTNYTRDYFYGLENSPLSDQVAAQICGNWFQGFDNGDRVIGIEENSWAQGINSSYITSSNAKIVLTDTLSFYGTNLSLSLSIPPSLGFTVNGSSNVYSRSYENEDVGYLRKEFAYPAYAKAGSMTIGFGATYSAHVDGYVNGQPKEAMISDSHSFSS